MGSGGVTESVAKQRIATSFRIWTFRLLLFPNHRGVSGSVQEDNMHRSKWILLLTTNESKSNNTVTNNSISSVNNSIY